METIDLRLDEENEIVFKVTVEGTHELPSTVRFICESGEVSYAFNGSVTSEGIKVVIPAMKGRITENAEHRSKLEVVVDGRYFVPLEVNTKFKEPLKVVAESVVVKNNITAVQTTTQPAVKASIIAKPAIQSPRENITPVIPRPQPKTIKIEQKILDENALQRKLELGKRVGK